MTIKEIEQNEKLKQWYLIIKDQRESDLTIKEYCKQNDLVVSTFYSYLKKIRNYLIERTDYSRDNVQLIPIDKPKDIINNPVTITKGSIKIEIDSNASYDDVEKIMRSLLC